MLQRDLGLATDGVSVRLSVCASHAGNVSKLMNLGKYDFHRRVAQGL